MIPNGQFFYSSSFSGGGVPTSTNATVQAWLNKIGTDGYAYPSQAKVDIYTTAWDYADAQGLTSQFDLVGLTKVTNENLCRIPFIHSGGPGKRFTLQNSPVFTSDTGLRSNGVGYMKTSWNPSVDAINFTLSSGSIFGKAVNSPAGVYDGAFLGLIESGSGVGILLDVASPNCNFNILDLNGGDFQTPTLSNLLSCTYDSASLKSYSNGILLNAVIPDPALSMPNVEMYALTISLDNTVVYSLQNKNLQIFGVGSGAIDQAKLNTFVNLLLL